MFPPSLHPAVCPEKNNSQRGQRARPVTGEADFTGELMAGKKLAKESAAVDFVAFALAHLKAIAHDAGAAPLLKAGNVGKDAGIVDAADTKGFIAAARTRQWAREPKVRTLA